MKRDLKYSLQRLLLQLEYNGSEENLFVLVKAFKKLLLKNLKEHVFQNQCPSCCGDLHVCLLKLFSAKAAEKSCHSSKSCIN